MMQRISKFGAYFQNITSDKVIYEERTTCKVKYGTDLVTPTYRECKRICITTLWSEGRQINVEENIFSHQNFLLHLTSYTTQSYYRDKNDCTKKVNPYIW